jgi:DNA topoisomerase-6 subunit A
LHNELKPGGKPRTKDSDPKLPVYCLLDNDPWGYYIYSVLKQGSINLAFESARMGLPDAKFIGLRSSDYERCQLSPSVQIKLNDQDRKRASQIAAYPWFEKKKEWQKEIQKMLSNGFKLEVEALISKDISYVTEEYVPQRLEEGDFLD